jgi:predicted Zn finger-like uncharacterized protein
MVISVKCPSCATSFPVDTNKVPVGGVNARCSVCSGIFRVERPEHTLPPPLAPDPGPAVEAAAPEPEAVPEFEPLVEAAAPEPYAESEPEPVVEAAAPEPYVESEPEPVVEAAAPESEPAPEPEPVVEAAAPEPEAASEPEPVEAAPAPDAGAAAEAEEPAAIRPPEDEDWVFEAEPEVRLDELDIPPLSTVERSVSEARHAPDPTPVTEGLETEDSSIEHVGIGGDLDLDLVPEDAFFESPESAPVEEAETPVEEPPAPRGFTLERRDPSEKAQRLARVLVSDMIMYNPERHQQALDNETLEEDFADEITKSWNEYVDQVGEELASGTPYWTDALNDILAKGRKVF